MLTTYLHPTTCAHPWFCLCLCEDSRKTTVETVLLAHMLMGSIAEHYTLIFENAPIMQSFSSSLYNYNIIIPYYIAGGFRGVKNSSNTVIIVSKRFV